LATLECLIEADLNLGRHHELLSELAGLVAEHPLYEDLHGQFMVALYRSGRRSDALEVFRRLRERLVEQLGLDPSAKLARLHQAILASHSALDVCVSDSAAPLLLDRLSLA
jgi:SARP family transcriptional regulator, regulator of embCAB operon